MSSKLYKKLTGTVTAADVKKYVDDQAAEIERLTEKVNDMYSTRTYYPERLPDGRVQ